MPSVLQKDIGMDLQRKNRGSQILVSLLDLQAYLCKGEASHHSSLTRPLFIEAVWAATLVPSDSVSHLLKPPVGNRVTFQEKPKIRLSKRLTWVDLTWLGELAKWESDSQEFELSIENKQLPVRTSAERILGSGRGAMKSQSCVQAQITRGPKVGMRRSKYMVYLFRYYLIWSHQGYQCILKHCFSSSLF